MRKGPSALVKSAAIVVFALSIAVPLSALAQSPAKNTAAPPLDTAPIRSSPLSPKPSGASPSVSGISDYVMGVGDKLQLTVFGEDDLSGEFQVSSTGTVSLPLIGEVKAAGQTVTQVQAEITNKLAQGYMKDPHVSLQVSSYRPFFIVGEVMKPGSYTYVNGMTVINAVALAGGYTYRADKDDIKLKHGGVGGKEEQVEENTPVMPGDVVTVPERFF